MTNVNRLQMHQRLTPELTDAGKRAADIINDIRAHHGWDELRHKWIAIRIADGSSDKVLYDTRLDCVKHQNREQECIYVAFQNLMGGASARDMSLLILYYRDAYKAGFRGIDTDARRGGVDLAMPSKMVDVYRSALLIPRNVDLSKFDLRGIGYDRI